MTPGDPPDIVLIGSEWPARALLRAQLIEEGYEIAAADRWPVPQEFLGRDIQPRLVIVDLHGLPDPAKVLTELRTAIGADKVLAIAALGTLTPEELRATGVHVIDRPASGRDIVEKTRALLGP
jgi:DNA-binding response OmpR family regulator